MGASGSGGASGIDGSAGVGGGGSEGVGGSGETGGAGPVGQSVIVFVWDVLRPDSVDPVTTPNLFALAQAGSRFTDDHATYPTFAMMNGASFAIGSFPGTTGFSGNTLYQLGPTRKDAGGDAVDFAQPVFTKDYSILRALDA
jgi:hypothetical protein